jgi:hypothetical protein
MDDLPVEELFEAMMEVFGERAAEARLAKAYADADGISLEVFCLRAVANHLNERGVPLPPKLRKHIAEHPDIPEALRRRLLTRDLS